MDLFSDLLPMLNHSKAYVRKKSVLVMDKILLQYPDALRVAFPRLQEMLDDADICTPFCNGLIAAVVSATVNVICELARKNPKNYLALAPQLFNLLTTSNNNWMVIKVIKLVHPWL
jgi:AP-3 complex subunit delta-1